MKQRKPNIGLSKLCWLFGVTRQAYYQSLNRAEFISIEQDLVLKEVILIRRNHPRIGTRKLYIMMEQFMLTHQIKMGRDALFDLLSLHGLMIRRRRRKVITTQSNHWLKKHPNLIIDFIPTGINQLWVSDITYWLTENLTLYVSFITDAYSHKIVGHNLARTLETIENLKSLQMALAANLNLDNLIHHSDRGSQYCCFKYVNLLTDYDIKISMTQTGDPRDNPVAERVNGILKGEYLECYEVDTFEQAKELLDKAVELYNQERPHMSIGNLVPEKVHSKELKKGEQKWKNYYNKKLQTNENKQLA